MKIIENWCLVKYCSLYDTNNINKNHWVNELTAHMYNILKRQLKNGGEDAKLQLQDKDLNALQVVPLYM